RQRTGGLSGQVQGEQPLREVVTGADLPGRPGGGLAQRPLGLHLGAATGTVHQVRPGTFRPGRRQVAVHERGDERSEMAHPATSAVWTDRVSITRGDRCARVVRSCARPRWIRERTVPIEIPSTSPISSYERPSMSQSTTAARYCG